MHGTRFLVPSNDLRPFVWVYVVRDESVRGNVLSVNRFPGVVYPSFSILLRGSVEASWGGKGPRGLPELFVSGAVTGPVASTNLGNVLSISVLFRPGVIPHISGERPSLLVDDFAGAEELWPREAAALRSRLAGLPVAQALPLVEGFLRQVLRVPRGRGGFSEAHRVRITDALSRLPIAEVVSRSGLSLRQFERRFVAQYGMTPKLFQQLRRFERAALALRDEFGAGTKGLALIAAECGYADQSHLVKDFQRFSGLNPTLLLRNVDAEAEYWVYRMKLASG